MDLKYYCKGVCDHYPEYLIEDRLSIEGNIIGCLAKDLLIFDDFKATGNDFVTVQGRFFYNLIKRLRDKGINQLDEVSVMTVAGTKVIERLNNYGGYSSLEKLAQFVSTDNWDAYVQAFTRSNLFLRLYDQGFNLEKKIKVNGELIAPYSLLSKLDPEEIVDFYTAQLSESLGDYSTDVMEDEFLTLDESFIEQMEEGREIGVMFDQAGQDINGNTMKVFPVLARSIMGFKRGTLSMLGAYSSVGKSSWWVSVIMSLLTKGHKVLMVSNEMPIEMFKKQCLSFILCKYLFYYRCSKKKMTEGNFTEEDKEMIRAAMDYMNQFDHCFKFIRLQDSNFELVKKKIRDNVLINDFDVVIYDTFKMDYSTSTNMKEYAKLIKDSRDLDVLAKKYNIVMLASIQLSMNTINQLYLTSNCLSQSKQIVEVLENLLLMRNLLPEEMDPTDALYCNPFKYVQNEEGSWEEEAIELDASKNYKVLFINKARNGANSDSTGTQLLYDFQGEFGLFNEIGYTRVRHKTI
ncbi:DnaB-like helicase C-terminal domain-containing protein [Ileibacterium valens]|uniref:DnaB-like helicase C-terminal domain-containing protein n=1 Tax=Ileibacterium valens TaxID=1862668 RepID=UPI002730619A|nr:DnaB-like helicase C-terminal domain-containing protein [Ileibacterium valens]